jgi:histidinol phosphatase-like enzyme (inositol monophosphatase family)
MGDAAHSSHDAKAATSAAIADRLALARALAREAGEVALQRFPRRGTLAADAKADGSPVTDADRAAEAHIRERLAHTFPDDGVLGEEFGETARRRADAHRWIVDPIDGTVSFMRGVPMWGTLIAVEAPPNESTHAGASAENAGTPPIVVGVLAMPALDEEVFASRGGGAWHRARDAEPVRATVSAATEPSDALLAITSRDYFAQAQQLDVYERTIAAFGMTRGWSDCYAHMLVATGRVDAVVEPAVLKPWDIAPMLAILPEAGGVCTDFAGRADMRRGEAICAGPALHARVLATVASRSGSGRTAE